MGGIQGVKDVLRLNVKSIDIVQVAVPGFGHHGQGPPVALLVRGRVLYPPSNHGIARHANAVRIGDDYWTFKKSQVVQGCGASHLAIAVQREPTAEYRICKILPPRQDYANAGPYWTRSNFQPAFPGNQGRVTHLHSLDVRDGVERPRRTVERNAKLSSSRFRQGRSSGKTKTGSSALPNFSIKLLRGKFGSIKHRGSSLGYNCFHAEGGMENWKVALVGGAAGVSTIMFLKRNWTAGIVLAGVGLATLASEYPEEFAEVRNRLPGFIERSNNVLEVASRVGERLAEAAENRSRTWYESLLSS